MINLFGYIDNKIYKETTSANNIEIYFQGAIYNKKDLLEDLNIKKDISDTQLIETLYKKFNKDFIKKIDAIFSLAIIDKIKNQLILARDKVGHHSLYYYIENNLIIFGTKLKDFYSVENFKKDIDKKGLSLFLKYGYIPQPYTIYKNCYKVRAGEYICYDLKNQNIDKEIYWSLEGCYKEKKIALTEEKAISDIKKLIEKSINKRLINSKNLAASLSGGYDSSTVAAFLTKTLDKKLDTFTIGFFDKNIDEAKYAKKVAKALNTNHHEYYFKDEDALDIVPKLSQIFDEPFADYGATPTVMLNRLLKKFGFDTLFVGDGGDEVFATADDVKRFETIVNIPTFYKDKIFDPLSKINLLKVPYLKNINNFPTKYYKFMEILKAKKISQMVKIKPILFFDKEIEQLLLNKDLIIDTKTDEIDFPTFSQTVDQVIGSYFKTSMVDAELIKSFQTSRYNDINLREPFLDIELINYMAKIEQNLKIKNLIKKYLLKEIAHEMINKELLERPKSGFNIPFASWLKGILKDLVYEHINIQRLQDDAIFDSKKVLYIRDQFYKNNDSYKYKLWTLFIFHLWYHENHR